MHAVDRTGVGTSSCCETSLAHAVRQIDFNDLRVDRRSSVQARMEDAAAEMVSYRVSSVSVSALSTVV